MKDFSRCGAWRQVNPNPAPYSGREACPDFSSFTPILIGATEIGLPRPASGVLRVLLRIDNGLRITTEDAVSSPNLDEVFLIRPRIRFGTNKQVAGRKS